MTKNKKDKWFKKVRSSYLPISWQGNLIYLLYVVYVVSVATIWCVNRNDYWELLVNVIPLLLASAALTQFVASKKS